MRRNKSVVLCLAAALAFWVMSGPAHGAGKAAGRLLSLADPRAVAVVFDADPVLRPPDGCNATGQPVCIPAPVGSNAVAPPECNIPVNDPLTPGWYNAVYLLNASHHWKMEKWISCRPRLLVQYAATEYEAMEVSMPSATGPKRFLLAVNEDQAHLYDVKEGLWALPTPPPGSVALEPLQPGAALTAGLTPQTLTPHGSPASIDALRRTAGAASGSIAAIRVRTASGPGPVETLYPAPPLRAWTDAWARAVDFTGRPEAFSVIELSGGNQTLRLHLNPWRGFAVATEEASDNASVWVSGRLLSGLPLESVGRPKDRAATRPDMPPGNRFLAAQPFRFAKYFTNMWPMQDFALPPSAPYGLDARIGFLEDGEPSNCEPAATTVLLSLSPKGGQGRTVFQLGERCDWVFRRWISLPSSSNPGHFAVCELSTPAPHPAPASAWLLGLNPWSAFIAPAPDPAARPDAPPAGFSALARAAAPDQGSEPQASPAHASAPPLAQSPPGSPLAVVLRPAPGPAAPARAVALLAAESGEASAAYAPPPGPWLFHSFLSHDQTGHPAGFTSLLLERADRGRFLHVFLNAHQAFAREVAAPDQARPTWWYGPAPVTPLEEARAGR